MTTNQKRKLLKRIAEVESDIETLKEARTEIGTNGYASATLASAGGSKSYTRLDISKITELISALTTELRQLRSMLAGETAQNLWRNVHIIYS